MIEKTSHRSFLPSFDKLSHGIYKSRRIVLILIAVLAIPAYTAQSMNDFLYGNDAVGASEGTTVYEDDELITAKFGRSNMMMQSCRILLLSRKNSSRMSWKTCRT